MSVTTSELLSFLLDDETGSVTERIAKYLRRDMKPKEMAKILVREAEDLSQEKAMQIAENVIREMKAHNAFMITGELRLGYVTELYYQAKEEKQPKQLDQLDCWFPYLIVAVEDSDENTKTPAWYNDQDYHIHAVRYHNYLYTGDSDRVTQLYGRLMGSAKANKEKERRSADLMRRNISSNLVQYGQLVQMMQENTAALLDKLNDDQLNRFFDLIFYMIVQLVGYREVMSEEERYDEEAPMHDNAYERLVYNVAYQFHLETYDGLVNAYVWLLLGSLLRDEIIPVIYMYSSSFKRIRNMPSQDMTLRDRIHYVLFPDDYYPVYEGDDPDAPFADITFTCDRCGAELNSQNGFDPSRETFACKKCGYVNKLSWNEVYENEEDYENNRAVDEEQSREALRRRKEELES